MRVLIAFDKFKDSLTSPEACAVAARKLAAAHPAWELDLCPLTDGGEGFCDILTRSADGRFESFPVSGPRGEPIDAQVGFVLLDKIPPAARELLATRGSGDRLAVVEMASASGLALLAPDRRDPWQTSSMGTGELIRAAAQPGVAAILLGVGGSATSDLGLGALGALGLDFLSDRGERIRPPIPADWEKIDRIAGEVSANLPPIRIACDVTNPLLGPQGAAAIYGPQKGLRAVDLPRLEQSAARLALLLCQYCSQPDRLLDLPGTGAAGGISFGLMAATGAQLLSGFDLVTAWLGLEKRIAAADIVITGEGRFDDSSLSGKGPGAVATRAIALGKIAHVFAGAITGFHARPESATSGPGPIPRQLGLHAITPPGMPLADALCSAADLLGRTIARVF